MPRQSASHCRTPLLGPCVSGICRSTSISNLATSIEEEPAKQAETDTPETPTTDDRGKSFEELRPSAADLAALERELQREREERARKEAGDAAAQKSATEERVAQARGRPVATRWGAGLFTFSCSAARVACA